MLNSALLFSSIMGYCLATWMIFNNLHRAEGSKQDTTGNDGLFNIAFIVAICSVVAHIIYALNNGLANNAIDFSLSSMAVIDSAILVSIYLLACLTMPIRRLGILVFPLSALSLMFSFAWHSDANYLNASGAFAAHVLVSILAYSLLTIAAIQALLYAYQERQLKKRLAPTMLLALPPLQTMEMLLFRLVAIGFFLLSLTLISGAFFSQQIFGQPFEFKHHTILAVLGWLVFATLLYKRYRHGLRGSHAVFWTLSGFFLIQLGYFGTKIITESISVQ
jgi:ABC-type uncharacterized transport system permease subunit